MHLTAEQALGSPNNQSPVDPKQLFIKIKLNLEHDQVRAVDKIESLVVQKRRHTTG